MYIVDDGETRLKACYLKNGKFYLELYKMDNEGFFKENEYSIDQLNQIDPNLLSAALENLKNGGYEEINTRPRSISADQDQDLYPPKISGGLSIAEAARKGLKAVVGPNGEEMD